MSNPDYSSYEHFIWVIEELLPRLPDIVQNHYHQLINDNTYGTPTEPKVGLVFEYIRRTNVKQVVTPLTILIECVATLFYAKHDLGPFHSHFKLEWQMRTFVTSFISNERDATCILHFMIEVPRWFEVEAGALEQEFNMVSTKGGNVMQDSKMVEASDVASSEGGNVVPAAAGDGLTITGLSFVNAAVAHSGPHTSSSTVFHLTSIDVSFNIKIDDEQPLPKPPDALTTDGDCQRSCA
ncbi:uncharacterized protein UHO2_00271 [Ustilago hordei]|uniref:Uncharacterized protein n=1 Tax=Ustilago hordei TaxID=120017 RepID=I2FXY8_USTHO|nr:uncharacterized protein UHO2_00271 [Ustilago hordei]CCF51781.1 uncharacterized protein UHOR_15121 [Ustilago hordei]SYW81766.1 related to GYP1 - GTPase activating protein [Ustilago hordei]